jgi:hypothetical protein
MAFLLASPTTIFMIKKLMVAIVNMINILGNLFIAGKHASSKNCSNFPKL